MKKILLIGGGGHCRSVIDTLLSSADYDEIGIIERTAGDYSPVRGIAVVGTDADLPRLHKEGWTDAFVTLGSVGHTEVRRRIASQLQETGFHMPTVIDRSAVIAGDVVIGDGTYVGKGAVINAGARIGNCAIINTGAILEHDCIVGSFAHVSTRAALCGQVRVGDDTHVGAGTVVRQVISIGCDALIGAGSVVVKDIPDGVTAYGNPCRVQEKPGI